MRPLPVLLMLLLLAIPAIGGETWSGRCVGITDGDTITVIHLGKAERIRLFGIDCPERRQDFSRVARKFTSDMVYGKVVEVAPVDRDRYGRVVAWVSVDGSSLNKELVRDGLAWWYRKYAPDRVDLAGLEEEARATKVGLWSMPNPVPPWEFRRRVANG